MSKRKIPPPNLDGFLEMFRETKDEPDRGRALVLTAWLDDALDQYLRTRVVDDRKVIESRFDGDRPLSTFSARMNAAYAFAYISKGVFHDLHAIRDIRNRFAHERGVLTFEDQNIKDSCHNLDVIQKTLAAKPVHKMEIASGEFLLTTLMYTSFFISRAEEWQHTTFMGGTEEQILIHDVIPKLMEAYKKSVGE